MEIFNDLARDIKNNVKKTTQLALSSSTIEIGKITNYGLQLNNFKHLINDYKTLDTASALKPLAIGDIVLVASFENDFIIIGRIN